MVISKVSAIYAGHYLPSDYPKLLALAVDRDNMFDDWADWYAMKEKRKRQLQASGLDVIDVIHQPQGLSAVLSLAGDGD